jgi:hypothetical protein
MPIMSDYLLWNRLPSGSADEVWRSPSVAEQARIEDRLGMARDAPAIGNGRGKIAQTTVSKAAWPINEHFKSAAVRREVSITRSARPRKAETTWRSKPVLTPNRVVPGENGAVASPYSALRGARHHSR